MKTTSSLEIVVLGSAGDFLTRVLSALKRADITVSATFAHGYGVAPPLGSRGRGPEIPLSRPVAPDPPGGLDIEFIPGIRTDAAYALLAECEPDVIVTACYAQILPARVLALPRLGCVNLHPSLLPAFRGPAPWFWQFHAGVISTGITVHRTTATVDGGDILAQQALPVPAGISAGQIFQTLGDLGGGLLVTVLEQCARDECTEREQDADAASYQPWPGDDAFMLDANWTAERVYRFMRGTRAWRRPYSVAADGKVLRLDDALTFEAQRTIDRAWIEDAGRFVVRFADGVVVATGKVGL